MHIHKIQIISLMSFISLMVSCTSSEEAFVRTPGENEICFTGGVNAALRATATAFESNDAISIFAFKDASGFSSGNYAANRKYIYAKNEFVASDLNQAIIYPQDESPLAFQAIYPYQESAGTSFTFTVKEDQSVGNNYTQSDLMVASVGLTTDRTPHLTFAHRLSNIVVNVSFDQTPAGEIKVDFSHVATGAIVDMQKATFKAVEGQIGDIHAASNGSNSYKAVLPPQIIQMGVTLATISAGGKSYPCKMTRTTEWKSGIQYVYDMHVDKEGEVTFIADIVPWDEPESPVTNHQLKRIVDVVSGVSVESTMIMDFTYDDHGRIASYLYPAYAESNPIYYPVTFTYGDSVITTKLSSNDAQTLETTTYKLNRDGNIVNILVEHSGGKFEVGLSYTDGYLTKMENAAEKSSLAFGWVDGLLIKIGKEGQNLTINYLSDVTYKSPINLPFYSLVSAVEFIFEDSNYRACILSVAFLNRLGKVPNRLISRMSGWGLTTDFQYSRDEEGYVTSSKGIFTMNGINGGTDTANFYY